MSVCEYDGLVDYVEFDGCPNCLLHNGTGNVVKTVAHCYSNPAVELQQFQQQSGWFVNWNSFPSDVVIYGILTPDDGNELQGLIALADNPDWQSVQIEWLCSAPWNRSVHDAGSTGERRYKGVGEHLFAVAFRYSERIGRHGGIVGFARDQSVLTYYMNEFGVMDRGKVKQTGNPNFFSLPGYFAQQRLGHIEFLWEE